VPLRGRLAASPLLGSSCLWLPLLLLVLVLALEVNEVVKLSSTWSVRV
jgi:hypothetical protein